MLKEIEKSVNNAPTVTIEESKEILGRENVFGPDECKNFFSNKFQVANIPEIPWSQDKLEYPVIKQEHFLFLGSEHLDGKSLNLPAWHKLYSGEGHPKFYWNWYLSEVFAQGTCGFRWYLMPVGIVNGSENLPYNSQVAMLPDEYEVPTTPERVTANIFYYLLNKKYLDADSWARTCDLSDGPLPLRVGVRGLSDVGLHVVSWGVDVHPDIGVSASLKI